MEHAGLVTRRIELGAAAQRVRKELASAGLAPIELPMLFTPTVGKAEVALLSRSLRKRAIA
jgi:hypothetical protein